MHEYILSCESTADLTREHLERRDLAWVPYSYQLDGKSYLDDLGQTIPYPDFYKAMTQGADTRTSQVNTSQFEAFFGSFLAQGKDILHLCLSSGITGSLNSAMAARETLLERYPDRKIYLVDSLAASSGFGLLMDKLADLRDEGMDIDTLYHWALDNRLRLHHWFFSTDLTFFIKGGRVSKTAGTIGGMLGICPLLNVSVDGKLIPREKIRSKKRVIGATVDKMLQFAQDGTNYSGKCYISHSACYEDARAVADLVEARFPHLQEPVDIFSIGTTIGSHTGPGTVALFFWGSPRDD